MKKIFFITMLVIAATAFTTCSQTNEPKPPEYKDPREMTWTADTLAYPGALQTLLGSIWGSSPNDIHVVGHCDDNDGHYWHYNGENWQCVDIFNYIERGSLTLRKVIGFSKDDFWIIGDRERFQTIESLIIHYNGSWNDLVQGYNSKIRDVNGTSSSNIWFCGFDGLVLNLHHNLLNNDTIKVNLPPQTTYDAYGIGLLDNEKLVLAKAYNFDIHFQAHYFIKGNIGNWQIVDSLVFPQGEWPTNLKWGDIGVFQIDKDNIYSYGDYGVWKLNNDKSSWTQTLRLNRTIRGLSGQGSNYLIATSDFGKLYFFDGVDWSELENLTDGQESLQFYNVWMSDGEIFLIGHITNSFPMRTVILHGK